MTDAEAGAVIAITQPLGIFAGELRQRAEEYREAAAKLDVGLDRGLVHAGYFLMAHAVELALKSYLAASGVPKAKLRLKPFGHDLEYLLRAANDHGMPPVADLADLVWHLARLNEDFSLRYPGDYIVSVPYADQSLRIIAELIEAVRRHVVAAHLQAQLDLAARFPGTKVEWSD